MQYGSVIFIAGNLPMVSEITPLIIITKLEQYDYAGATAVAAVMLVVSFALLLLINALQLWTSAGARGLPQSAAVGLHSAGAAARFERNVATRDPAWVRYLVLGLALGFFAIFLLLLRSSSCSRKRFRKGWQGLSRALVEPDALSPSS